MGTLRAASAYTKRNVTPYTRVSKRRQKSYIKTVPAQKIVKFTMGKKMEEKKLKHILKIVTAEKQMQIRHNAMEACRQFINKKLEKELNGNYGFKILPFPHHIQRENKMITGAGADRMQTGMQLSYGKSMGKAAIVKEGKCIFLMALPDERAVVFARKIIKQVKPKIPGRTKVTYEKLK
jgi:large subunit ribosomal protein L10e